MPRVCISKYRYICRFQTKHSLYGFYENNIQYHDAVPLAQSPDAEENRIQPEIGAPKIMNNMYVFMFVWQTFNINKIFYKTSIHPSHIEGVECNSGLSNTNNKIDLYLSRTFVDIIYFKKNTECISIAQNPTFFMFILHISTRSKCR